MPTHLTLSLESLRFLDARSTVAPTIDIPLISTSMSPAWILREMGEEVGGRGEGGREQEGRRGEIGRVGGGIRKVGEGGEGQSFLKALENESDVPVYSLTSHLYQ